MTRCMGYARWKAAWVSTRPQRRSRFLASDFFARLIPPERRSLAFCSSARRLGANPRPARFMKYVSIRSPEPGPFGETSLDARARAIVAAFFANNPGGGWVESVLTLDTHLFAVRLAIGLLCPKRLNLAGSPGPSPGIVMSARCLLAHPSMQLRRSGLMLAVR